LNRAAVRGKGLKVDNDKKKAAIEALNHIMELELAGVVRYTHYALMVYGYNRIPIVSWLKDNATESLAHAYKAGEFVTLLGGHPSLRIGPLLETQKHDIGDILRESLEQERTGLDSYYALLKLVDGHSVLLEEYARDMIVQEETHLDEVNKMLRKPGVIEKYQE
jgi:bacterioferritin